MADRASGWLDSPIQATIDATNRGDREALLDAFAESATLADFGGTFAGRAEIARWNDDENIGTQTHIEITRVARSGGSVRLGIVVTGNGCSGPGSMGFKVDHGRITSLRITGSQLIHRKRLAPVGNGS
jgi:hypothetical protein